MSSFLDTLGKRGTREDIYSPRLVLETRSNPRKDLYDAIRRHITSKQGAVAFIKNLERQAITYSYLRNPGHECWSPLGPPSRRRLRRRHASGHSIYRPLLVAVLLQLHAPEIRKALPMLVAWTVRFMIVGRSGSGRLKPTDRPSPRDI